MTDTTVSQSSLLEQIARDKAAFEALSPTVQKSMLNELRSIWGSHLLPAVSQSPPEQPASNDAVREAVHRGWRIEQNWIGEWEATHPDFDPTPNYVYDGPSDNRFVRAKTRKGVIEEIDCWIEENEDA